MNTRIEKLINGLKTDPFDTLARATRYLMTRIGGIHADLLYLFFVRNCRLFQRVRSQN